MPEPRGMEAQGPQSTLSGQGAAPFQPLWPSDPLTASQLMEGAGVRRWGVGGAGEIIDPSPS